MTSWWLLAGFAAYFIVGFRVQLFRGRLEVYDPSTFKRVYLPRPGWNFWKRFACILFWPFMLGLSERFTKYFVKYAGNVVSSFRSAPAIFSAFYFRWIAGVAPREQWEDIKKSEKSDYGADHSGFTSPIKREEGEKPPRSQENGKLIEFLFRKL